MDITQAEKPSVFSALETIKKSRTYFYIALISVLLSLKRLDNDEKKLYASLFCPKNAENIDDNFKLNITSNILDCSVILFFYNLSKKNLQENQDEENCSPKYNFLASSLVLIATLIRLYELICNENNENSIFQL